MTRIFDKPSTWWGRSTPWCLIAVAIWMLSGVLAAPSLAQQAPPESAARFLPPTTAIFLQIDEPAQLFEKLEKHPILQKIQKLEQVQQALKSPDVVMAMLARGMLEAQLGENILETLKANTSRGISVGVDAKTEGVIIMARAKDETRLKRVAGQILKFVSDAAASDGKKVPFKRGTYRDAVFAKFDDFVVVRHNDWLLISNKTKLAQSVVDRMIDGPPNSLASEEWFREAFEMRHPADVWGAVDLKLVRQLAPHKIEFQGRTHEPGVELFFGGVLDLLKQAPSIAAELNLNHDLELSIYAPFDASWANASREFFFGKQLQGRAPQRLAPKHLIASLTAYRDLGAWWRSKEELYEEKVIDKLAKADSQLSVIFPGMDFGEDVLSSLEPGVQIVVTDNHYVQGHLPDIKVPAFALVGKLKEPEKMRRKLKIAFQSVVGFANINLGTSGLPQLETETERKGEAYFMTSQYYLEDGAEEGLLLFNFAPTLAFQGSHLILSSNRELAIELAQLLAQPKDASTDDVSDANTQLWIDGPRLTQLLKSNTKALITQNMIEKGNDRATATKKINTLLTIAQWFRSLAVDYRVTPSAMRLDLSLKFNP